MAKDKILCIIGRSGSGKTTLERMLSLYAHLTYHRVVSCTTRPMREGERQGVEHRFVSPRDMPPRIRMIARTRYGGYDYWAERPAIRPGCINTYVIDADGYRYLRDLYSDDYDLRVLYVRRPHADGINAIRRERDAGRITLLAEETDIVYTNDGTITDLTRDLPAIDSMVVRAFAKDGR